MSDRADQLWEELTTKILDRDDAGEAACEMIVELRAEVERLKRLLILARNPGMSDFDAREASDE